MVVFGYHFCLQAAVSPALQFTEDTILQLENVLSGDLFIIRNSACDNISVNGKTFTATSIPAGSSFALKTPIYNPTFSIFAVNAPVILTFSSDNFLSGRIANFTLTSTDPGARASIVWNAPNPFLRYTVKVNGANYADIDANSQGQISFACDKIITTPCAFALDIYRGGAAFIPPAKPDISGIEIVETETGTRLENVPDNITQIAISRTSDFKDVSWQTFDPEKFKTIADTTETLYVKFRTDKGTVSDVITYEPKSSNRNITLNEGDIVKTLDNPDVYIIKYEDGKQYKRLVLSSSVFDSYGHLKWSNIKTISQNQLDDYAISNLVRIKGDPNIYELTSLGDTGRRRMIATYDNGILRFAQDDVEEIGISSIYEINQTDGDSYALAG